MAAPTRSKETFLLGILTFPILACSTSSSGLPISGSDAASGVDASIDATLPGDASADGAPDAASADAARSLDGGPSPDAGDAALAFRPTFANADDAGNPVLRFDVDGNAIDAHDGGLYFFAGSYWLYGTSYNCGYLYQSNSTFCGFKAYSSPDLVHFTDRGLIVPAQSCQYCFRPHVVYDAKQNRYVLWVNSSGGLGGGAYTVFTSPAPGGPFTSVGSPTLNRPAAIDYNLFVDDDAERTGYLLHNDTASTMNAGGVADLVIEKLGADYTAPVLGAADYVELGLTDVEAMSAFKRNGTYYVTMSDPTCAYCASSTGYLTASSMLGPWQGISTVTPPGLNQNGNPEPSPDYRSILISGTLDQRHDTDSCSTQATNVTPLPLQGGGVAYLFMGDQWTNRQPNESLATYFWAPLSFDADGGIAQLACPKEVSIPLAQGEYGADVTVTDLDATSGSSGFRAYCDVGTISGAVVRTQTFTASRSGTLTNVAFTTFKRGTDAAPTVTPDAPLVIDIVDAASPAGGAPLFSVSTAATALGWSPRNLVVTPSLAVTAGHTYAIVAHSSASVGCYGFAYDDSDAYSGGNESYSTDSGATFTGEATRDLKFWTAVH